jgi:hypothetical protein
MYSGALREVNGGFRTLRLTEVKDDLEADMANSSAGYRDI